MDEYEDLLKNLPTDKPKHPYEDIIQRHAARTGLDPDLVKAVMHQESSNNPRAVSPKGARGLMQLMPATAARYGAKNVNDPEQNITAGTDYLKFLSDKYGGDLDKTLAGYNSGEGAVDRWSARGHNIPPYKETQNYVRTIKKRYGKSGTGGDYSQYDDLLANLDNPQQPAQQQPAAPEVPAQSDETGAETSRPVILKPRNAPQPSAPQQATPPVASGAPAVIAPDYVPPAGPVVADPNDTPSFGTPEERARMAAAQNQPSVIDIGTNLMLARQKSQEIQLQRRHQAAKAAPPTLRHPGAQPAGEPWKAKGATGGLRVNQVPAEAQPTDALSAALNAGANPTSRFGAIKAAVAQPFDPNSPENAQRSQIREQIVNELHPTTAKGRIKQGADVAITTAINPLNVINPSLGAKVAAAQAARRLGLPVQSEDELINAETEKRLSAQQMQAAPEMTQARKNFGKLDPVTRSLSVIPAALFGDAAKMAGGVTSAAATVTGLAGLTPNIVSDYLQTKSDTFNKYGNLFQQASSAAPLDEQGKEIERARTQILGVSVPTEKIARAIGELGTNIGELVLLKRATGMPLDRVMAIETALKTSDLPANERAVRVAESYGMGKVLEAHLSRPVSALLFGGPTAVQSAQSVASGNMSLEDAILNTSIQAGTGAVFGGKKGNGTIRDAEPTGLRERLVNKARLKVADEANPQGRLFTDSGRKVAPTSNVGQTEPTAPRPVEPRQGNLPFEPRQPEPAATEAKNELTTVLQSAIDKSKEPAPEKLTRKEQSLADQEAYAKAQGNYFEETPSGAAPPEQPGQATSTDRRRDTRLATPEEKALLDAAVATHGERRKAEDQRDIANRRAETDKLTGLGNRDALDKALPAAEKDPNTSVVVFDANNLGIVNKLVEHGEIAGDTVVQRAANAINQAAQEAGVPQRVFRRGGDEFVALLPKTQADAITARAEEIMGEQTFKGTHGQTDVPTTARTSLTGSVGDTFEIADRALQGLKAKRKAEGIAAAPATEKAPAKATKAKKTKAAEEAAPQSPEVAQAEGGEQNAVPKRKSTKVPVADAAQTSEEVGAPVPKPKESSDAQGTTTPAPEKVGFRKGDKVTTEEGEGTVDSINGNRVRVMLADGETTRVYPAEALTAKPKTASEKALDKLKKDSAQAGKLAFGDIVGTISKKAEDAFYRAVIKADDYLTSRKEGKFSEWVKSIPSEERIDTPTMRKAFDGAKALQEKERQFPKSAVEAGHTQPTDLTYTVLSNPEAVASAQKTIEDKGLNKAVLDLAHAKDLDAPDIALGILAAKQYASKGDHESEVSVLNDLSAKLTKAGRVVQAASLIDNLTPEGAIIRASRKLAEKSPGAKLSTEQADVIREKVSAIQLAKARVEKYAAKEVALTKGHGSIQDQLEARLGANAEKARAELKRLAQQGGFLGTSPKLPSALKAKLNLFAQVGAHELAKLQGSTGKMEAWKKAMVALDPRLEPFLNKEIFKESYSLFDSTKKSLLEQQRLNSARKTNPLATPSELRVIVNEKLDAQTAARKESIALRRYYDSLGIPTWKKMRDAVTGSLGIYRASESSFDLSASLRQAKIALVRSPAAFAKAFGKQIQAVSPEKYERLLSQLQLDPDFKYAERFGLDLVGFGEHEEAFDAAKLVQNIPGIKHSEQAYTTMLNYTRMGWFKQYSEGLTRLGLDPDNPADRAHFEKGAQMINNATGRGDWGKGNAGALLRSTSHTLSMALFSPRFLASRLYLLKEAGNPLTMLNPKVIAAVGKDIVSKTGRMTNISALEKLGQRHALSNEGRVENFKTVAAYAAVVGMQLTLAKQLGAQVSFDMDDPDFLKAKFGNYHVDVSAGMQGTVRMLLRTMKAIYRGEIAERSGKGESVMGIQSDFWRKKLSPAAAILVDMFGNKQNTGFGADWEGKDFLRQPTYMFGKPGAGLNKINPLSQDGSIIMRKLAPMIADDVKKVIYDNPIDKKGVAAIAGSVLGESIQIYDPKASGKPLRKPKPASRPRISH
jgi:diguanylate cyclase (GGDEF)-like protein